MALEASTFGSMAGFSAEDVADLFAEEDAYLEDRAAADRADTDHDDDPVATEAYLALSTSEVDCVPISEEDLISSGLHRESVRGQATLGTLGHALRHEPSARLLNVRTGIKTDDYEGLSSSAADQAVAIRDLIF